jgi:glutamine cyclotransferase
VLDAACDAGTAFDGTHLFQLTGASIHKIDPATGTVVASIPAPGTDNSGLAWADGSLWIGQYRARRIYQLDPASGAILRTIDSNRFVTGVTWVDGELWHGTWEGDASDVRRIDPDSGAVLARLELPAGAHVSGLESDGADLLYAGGGKSGKVRAIRRPRRKRRA